MQSAIITIIGKLGKDAETKQTSTGKTVTKFSVAVSTGSGDAKTADWFDVNCWFKLSDYALGNLVKGNTVMVTGRFQKVTREYNGKNYESLAVNAFTVDVDKSAEGRPVQPEPPQNEEVPF